MPRGPSSSSARSFAASFPDWWKTGDAQAPGELSPADRLSIAVALLGALLRQARSGGALAEETLPLTVRAASEPRRRPRTAEGAAASWSRPRTANSASRANLPIPRRYVTSRRNWALCSAPDRRGARTGAPGNGALPGIERQTGSLPRILGAPARRRGHGARPYHSPTSSRTSRTEDAAAPRCSSPSRAGLGSRRPVLSPLAISPRGRPGLLASGEARRATPSPSSFAGEAAFGVGTVRRKTRFGAAHRASCCAPGTRASCLAGKRRRNSRSRKSARCAQRGHRLILPNRSAPETAMQAQLSRHLRKSQRHLIRKASMSRPTGRARASAPEAGLPGGMSRSEDRTEHQGPVSFLRGQADGGSGSRPRGFMGDIIADELRRDLPFPPGAVTAPADPLGPPCRAQSANAVISAPVLCGGDRDNRAAASSDRSASGWSRAKGGAQGPACGQSVEHLEIDQNARFETTRGKIAAKN